MDMDVTELDARVIRVRLSGRMDTPGVDRGETRFLAGVVAPGRPALVDLSGVTILTSMGLRLLISAARSLAQKHAKLVLYGAPTLIHEVLENAAMGQIMPIVATEPEALAQIHA